MDRLWENSLKLSVLIFCVWEKWQQLNKWISGNLITIPGISSVSDSFQSNQAKRGSLLLRCFSEQGQQTSEGE